MTFADHYQLFEPIDNPEGHYARVYKAQHQRDDKLAAFKIMRYEHLRKHGKKNKDGDPQDKSYAWQAFQTEARALATFGDRPEVVDFYDCGYCEPDPNSGYGDMLPTQPRADSGIASMGQDYEMFAAHMDDYILGKGWLPYISMELVDYRYATHFDIRPKVMQDALVPRTNTLQAQQAGTCNRYPPGKILRIFDQFVDLLVHLQAQGFAYRDHKLPHIYWLCDQEGEEGRIKIIDWNGGEFLKTPVTSHVERGKLKTDVEYMILLVLFTMLTGVELVSTQGVASNRLAGITVDRVFIPTDNNIPIPGKEKLEPFFKAMRQGQYADADALRAGLDKLLLAYGISPASGTIQVNGQDRAARQHIDDLIAQKNEALQDLIAVKRALNEQLGDYDGPFYEEAAALHQDLEHCLLQQKIITW